MIKVFRLNDEDLWAGEDLDSVKAAYLKETGVPEDEAFDDPREIEPEEMLTRKILLDDERTSEATFAEALAIAIAEKWKFPCYFGGTEY